MVSKRFSLGHKNNLLDLWVKHKDIYYKHKMNLKIVVLMVKYKAGSHFYLWCNFLGIRCIF